ncbi:MAG: polymer-forming cytoskeletal protein [Curvibacter sp.]|nr:polymer-forming cytoskeletal protein [Curvibacter sp.]
MATQPRFFGKSEPEILPGRSMSGSLPAQVPAPSTAVPAATPVAAEGGSKLTVGPNIKLKGVEITDCDTLVVEGLVEATMDSRLMQIAEKGAFKGAAEIDLAEIRGRFDGDLTVRQKLVIHATGRVSGKIRYGKLIIEEGGQLSGQIDCAAAGSDMGSPRPVVLDASSALTRAPALQTAGL